MNRRILRLNMVDSSPRCAIIYKYVFRSKEMRKVRNTNSRALFVKDSPYKPRSIRNKKAYSRKTKHKVSR